MELPGWIWPITVSVGALLFIVAFIILASRK
jgi:hypothetical protein